MAALAASTVTDTSFRPADYVGLAWHQFCKMACPDLRGELRQRDLWEDVRQEVVLAAFQAEVSGYDVQETSRFVQCRLYQALVNMGFRRPRGGGYYFLTVGERFLAPLNGEEHDET